MGLYSPLSPTGFIYYITFSSKTKTRFNSTVNLLAGSSSVILEAPPHCLLHGQAAVMKLQTVTMAPTLFLP